MNVEIKKIQQEKPIEELIRFSIINLDKPTGPTSFSVSDYIRKKLKINKTSHFGTLDPQVTGVLPIGLGRACRLSNYFMHRDKEYVGIMRLHQEVDEKVLRETIKKFIGKITQLPPVRSRVKRAERVREVKSFDILEIDGKDILFKTIVQAGTYIRKLIHDLGEQIGGAHMLELRRTQAGMFSEENIIDLYDFDKAVEDYAKGNDKLLREILIPAEIIREFLPPVQVKADFIKKLLTGSPIFNKFIKSKSKFNVDEKICVFSNEKFIGCYKVVNQKDILAVPEFVFN